MFTTSPCFIPSRDHDGEIRCDLVTGLPLFKMDRDLVHVDLDGNETRVRFDEESDMGSVPPVAWPALHPHDLLMLPTYRLHDHDYGSDKVSRWRADIRFFLNARAAGKGVFICAWAWFLLRAFGWMHYRKIRLQLA